MCLQADRKSTMHIVVADLVSHFDLCSKLACKRVSDMHRRQLQTCLQVWQLHLYCIPYISTDTHAHAAQPDLMPCLGL